MRGLHPPSLVLLLLLTVNGQQEDAAAVVEGVEVEVDSSSSDPIEISDELGTSEEEACSDCEEEASNIIEEEVQVEASNNATELKVLESATYSMASIGSTSIFVRLDRVDGQENLQMVCQISETGSEELFKSEDCKPSIYIIAENESCVGLSGNVTAQKLAHVDKAGEGESEVEVTWNDLKGSCMVFLRPRSCDEEESESVVEVAEEGDGSSDEEETSEEANASEEETGEAADASGGEAAERKGAGTPSREGINWEALTLEQQQRQPRRIRGSLGILRQPQAEPALRVFRSISLDSFTLLSSGTTSAFAVATYSKVTSPIYNGLVATTYNPWATFPIVQLPGLTPEHVALVAATGLLLLFAFSYLTSDSSLLIRQRVAAAVESGEVASRMEALGVGVADIVHRTAVETPYEFLAALASKIDRGLLRSPAFSQSTLEGRLDQKVNEDWASYDYSLSAFS